ncbi:MAG TPA: tetratricopeptide repeat protein, partial [Acidobacteriota bacterium]|nr:tetratricopeptide repeat protein [Acidobacteriota bacterium]
APDDYRWPYCRALVMEESGREKEVPDMLLTALRLKGDFAPALQKLADIYYRQDNLDEAERYYQRCASVARGDSLLQPLFGLGRVAARRKDWSKVVKYVAPLSLDFPYIRPTRQLLVEAYEGLGQSEKAATERESLRQPKLIVIPPIKDPLMDELLALCCSSTRLLKEAGLRSRFGHPDQAIEVVRRAIEVEPEDADARHYLARTLLDTHGDKTEAVDDALVQLREGLRLRPDDLLPLWYFAANFFEKEKTTAAVEQLRTMLMEHAGSAEGHYYLGVVADHLGRTQEAVAQYQAALKANPDYAEAYHKLGLILVSSGKLDEAIEYFRRAVQLSPMFTTARSNLGVAFEERGKTGQAIAEFEEALRLKPGDGPTHMFLGIALLKSGKIEQAAEHFRETVRISPGEAQAHYGLGCVLAIRRKTGEAIEELREALRLRPDYPEARDLLQKLERR